MSSRRIKRIERINIKVSVNKQKIDTFLDINKKQQKDSQNLPKFSSFKRYY